MSQHTPPLSLTDEKLDRLEELLDDPALEDSLRLDEAQGYLCAALTGPSPMQEEQWLADILGSEEALETSAGKEAAELLREFAQAMENTLVLGEAPELLLYPVSEAEDSPNDSNPGARPTWPASTPPKKTGSSFLVTKRKTSTKKPARNLPGSTPSFSR